MKHSIISSIVIGLALTTLCVSAQAEEMIIFGKERPIEINYSKCGTDIPKMGVKVDQKKWTINWKWENKSQTWCGWGTESIPINDISKFLSGNLVIKFIGGYQGRPPEVKFIDLDDTHTSIVSIH